MNNNKNIIILAITALVILGTTILHAEVVTSFFAKKIEKVLSEKIADQTQALGTFAQQGQANVPGSYRVYTLLNKTTATGSSTPISIAGAKKATVFFGRGDTTGQGNAGSSVFNIAVSGDDTTYVGYNKIIDNVTNTNGQTLTRVGAITLPAGTSTKAYTLDLEQDAYLGLKCGVTESTDGEHTCKVLVEY